MRHLKLKGLLDWRRSRLVTVVLALASLVTGCAHSLVYDEKRDKSAQETRKTVTEAHVTGTVATLERTFADVAAREESAARERQDDLFDLEVRTVSRAKSLGSKFDESGGIDGLITVLQARLGELGLPTDNEQLTKLRTSDASTKADVDALQVTLAEFRGTVGHQFGSCAEVYAASDDPANKSDKPSKQFEAGLARSKQKMARLKFPSLIEGCKKVDEGLANNKAIYSNEKSLVKDLIARTKELDAEILAYETAKSMAYAAIDAAATVFKESGAQGATEPGKSKLQSLENRVQRLRKAIAQISKSSGAGHAVAIERLQRLEAVLAAIAGSPSEGAVPLTQDQQVAVAMVRDLPALADEADKLFAEAAKPRLVPFLIAIEHQKLVLQGFEVGQGAKRKQAEAVRNQLQAALDEGVAIARVLQLITKDPSWSARSIGELEGSLQGARKSELHRALAIYADDVQRHRSNLAVWSLRERAAIYEEGLAQSKFIAAQWDGLMDAIANVLADYHAAGIKQADIAEFFKALGLITIGVGVAQ